MVMTKALNATHHIKGISCMSFVFLVRQSRAIWLQGIIDRPAQS
jgi:hypothetical protein